MRPVLRRAALGRRIVDLVVQVWLQNGETTWLLIHVEVQGKAESDFSERMFAYAALLYLRFRARGTRQREQLPPPPAGFVGIAVLTDTNPAWQPDPFAWGWGEYGVQYRYRTLKLADWRERAAALAGDARPFAWVVRTALAVQGARRAEDAQADVRRVIGRQLLAARRAGSVDAAQASAIYTFLDALGGLSDTLAEAIDQEFLLAEEGAMQEVLNRYERRALERGLERGLEQGLEQGRLELVLLLLIERCGPLDDALRTQVMALEGDDLLALGKALLGFAGQADLRRWLEQHAARR